MQILRDESIEQFLLEEIQANLGDGIRDGLHFSDLLSPKQAFWQRNKPQKASKHEIIYWLSGHAHESMFLHVSDLKHGEPKQWEGIWYTPDVFYNFPVELKTTRRGFVVKEGEEEERYAHYLKQLRYYCAAEIIQQGWLIVWYLVMLDENRRNTKPDYFCYRVEFTVPELLDTRDEMLSLRDRLENALLHVDVSGLPDCEPWMCYSNKKVMIEKPKCLTCDKEFTEEWRIKKHLTSKVGKGHEVKKGVYSTITEPRCKYSEYCKPEIYNTYCEWKKINQPDEESEEE